MGIKSKIVCIPRMCCLVYVFAVLSPMLESLLKNEKVV